MKKIKKYIKNMETEGLASKLASYSALAASVVSFAPDMNAQCVPAGGSLPIDIDGDGVTDITVNHTTTTVFASTGTNTAYFAAGPTTSSGPYTVSIAGPIYTSGGCGPLTPAAPWVLNLSTVFQNFQYVYNVQVSFTYVAYNLNYVSAGANQLVGLSVGSDVCAGISAGGTASTFGGFNYYAAVGSVVNVFTSYYYVFANFVSASAAQPVSNPAGCTLGGNPIATFTYVVTPFTAGPYAGGSQIAGPSSNVSTATGAAALPALGVQFQSPTNGGTINGWAQLSIGADGLLCVDATGFNGCSVEEVAAAGAAAGTECIAVGDATSNTSNEACAVLVATCTIDGVNASVSACDDAGTTAPDNSADGDDTAIITVDPAGTLDDGAGNTSPLAGSYAVTGLPTATTGTFGTPLTETVPADGATYTITVTYTDPNDGTTCTAMMDVTAPAACSLEPGTTDIPTLSEWGLITLALMLMSYGSLAMVGTAGLAGSTRSQTFNFGSKMFSIPFDNRVYRKALMLTGLIAAAGFTGCFAMYGAIFMSDIIGTAIAGPVFAYLAHLLYLLETRREKK